MAAYSYFSHGFAGNAVIAPGLLLVPLLLEWIAMQRGDAPGVGLEVFQFEPLDNALAIAAFSLFVVFNGVVSHRANAHWAHGPGLGIVLGTSWTLLAFLLVLQVHLWRGGMM